MLDISPNGLLREIFNAEEVRQMHLKSLDEQIKQYHGPWYSTSGGPDSAEAFSPENHYYEWISHMVPQMVFNNPRTKITSRRPASQKFVAEAIQWGENRWIRDSNFKSFLQKAAVDSQFRWAIALTSQGPRPDYMEWEDPGSWPTVTRIPQNRFGWDPQATSFEEVRFMFHMWGIDKEDAVDLAKENPDEWNIDVIESIGEDTGKHKYGKDPERNWVERGEIFAYEVWVPEVELEDSPGVDEGFHGTIFTIPAEDATIHVEGAEEETENVQYLRPPRPYYGPRWGPYTLIGMHYVPDETAPLATLVAVEGQIKDLNDHARATSDSAARYKKLVFVNSAEADLPQKVKDSEHHFVISVQGLEPGQIVQVELGGASPSQLEYLQVARDRLDRNSGFTDIQRGNISGGATATEATIATTSGNIRLDFIKDRFTDGVVRILRTVAWYLYHDDTIEFPLGEEASNALSMSEPWFQGGEYKEESGATFDDLELEIEPYSMERVDEAVQQKRIMEMIQILVELAPLIPQMPWVQWQDVFEKLGEAMNIPDLGQLIDITLAMQFAGQEEGTSGRPPGFQPRLSRDAGKVGVAGQKSSARKGLGGGSPGRTSAHEVRAALPPAKV